MFHMNWVLGLRTLVGCIAQGSLVKLVGRAVGINAEQNVELVLGKSSHAMTSALTLYVSPNPFSEPSANRQPCQLVIQDRPT